MAMELELISWREWKWSDPCQPLQAARQQWRKEMPEKGEWFGVGRAAGGWPPFALPILYIVHIVPGQMRPIFSSEEVSVRRCTAVFGGQMDQHMAWVLLFRCCECCVTLNKAQVHTFKSFTGQYGNLYHLLVCDVQSVPSLCFLKECVRHPCHIRFTTLSTAKTLRMWAPSLHLTWQKYFFFKLFLCNYDSFYSARNKNNMTDYWI